MLVICDCPLPPWRMDASHNHLNWSSPTRSSQMGWGKEVFSSNSSNVSTLPSQAVVDHWLHPHLPFYHIINLPPIILCLRGGCEGSESNHLDLISSANYIMSHIDMVDCETDNWSNEMVDDDTDNWDGRLIIKFVILSPERNS